MELANIENLLEKYFEATTTVQEEQELQAYFSQDNVAPHLQEYQPMFQCFTNLKAETSTRNVPLQPRKNYLKWISVAAVFVLTTSLFINEWNKQRQAEEAFEYFKTTMALVSQSFNSGASHINYLTQFEETTNKIFKTENN
ncbi:hypothetical protein C8N46_102298 [Kordia periserrulae]|uniref:Uncharacterized protein n=1 Tax=Kordia periserrulae TaxID=701523 RepID=A0A2T6C3Q9_9FLAO|nr:hypothetical protein [Kordia periserrulae]PTX62897.1 hypothetical protein C8N46_102298 [Kordia periserrulae]